MKFPPSVRSCAASLAVAVALLLSPVASAQRPARQPPAPTPRTPTNAPAANEQGPAATFDTLLSADAYGVYAELRMVGQQASSEEIVQFIKPLTLGVSGKPDELVELYEFVKAHAEALTTARLMVAAMPVRAGLPEVLVALEMPSVEEARKFLPQLREFVAAKLAPRAADAPSVNDGSTAAEEARHTPGRRGRRRARATTENARGEAARSPAASRFQVKRSGSVIAMSNGAFTFRNLRGQNEALLVNEPGFQAARTRLSAETLFVYFNTVRMFSSTKMQNEALEKEYRRQEELARAETQKPDDRKYGDLVQAEGPGDARAVSNTNGNANTNANVAVAAAGNMNAATNANVPAPPEDDVIVAAPPTPEATPSPKDEKELEEERRREQSRQFAQTMGSLIFGEGPRGMSSSSWPESIGVGASLEADSIVVRGLFVNLSDNEPLRPIPFLPVVLSGPSIAAEAPNVLPAETDIFVTMSLDLPQMYDYLTSMMKILDLAAASGEGKGGLGEQLNAFEKTNNFRIKEELLAALGNEIAVGLPSQFLGMRAAPMRNAEASAGPILSGPVAVIALNDKKGLQELLPRVLAAIGFAGATEQSIIEKHGDVELLNFSNGTLAFIDRFLVSAPDAATMRRITDAYNKGETLANSQRFRDTTSWQSRQAVGQIYLSNRMLRGMFEDVSKAVNDIEDEAVRAFLIQLDPDPGAISHSATRESNGLMHEIHLPKNLLSLVMASDLVSQKLSTLRANESTAGWKLRTLQNVQTEYRASKGRYGTLEELKAAGHFDSGGETLEMEGYELKVTVSGDKFEATATPKAYPKLGRRSFYIDQTGDLRGGDTGGKAASASDPVIDY